MSRGSSGAAAARSTTSVAGDAADARRAGVGEGDELHGFSRAAWARNATSLGRSSASSGPRISTASSSASMRRRRARRGSGALRRCRADPAGCGAGVLAARAIRSPASRGSAPGSAASRARRRRRGGSGGRRSSPSRARGRQLELREGRSRSPASAARRAASRCGGDAVGPAPSGVGEHAIFRDPDCRARVAPDSEGGAERDRGRGGGAPGDGRAARDPRSRRRVARRRAARRRSGRAA